ncbi:50S ribosomal protein L25 [Acidaminobacter sp.]|uniref:50S ribosomal protein L25 n=1 Tax=Acidaminobacter sp. TaxID=1872102 RepID=UPI0013856508|nr:50S ribosomal protein L25 [Acidaminobacter sp.]MDK9710238.1 50S ribosomal protein L25 [Acidaminobacter sp.]MZQ98676.1 50S ribosomal protein L25 [Acidaminobacter sp.]
MRELIQANLRTEVGKNKIKYIRTQGYVPAVIYGHNKETRSIKLDRKQMDRFLMYHTKGSTLDVEINGKSAMVVLKDFQRRGLKDQLIHVDFQELSANETVKIPVPILVKNREYIERIGAILEDHLTEIEIEALPSDLIEHVYVDVEGMAFGDVVRVSDLVFENMEKVTLLTDLDLTVLAVSAPSKEEEVKEGAEDEPAEPELIGSKE